MTDINYHEAIFIGGEPESVFPIPRPFRDPIQVSAAISDQGRDWIDLLPGLEYIVNHISDAHGELILLGEELREGKTLRIRIAETGEAVDEIAARGAVRECGRPCQLLAEVRNDLEYFRNDTASRFSRLERQAAEHRLARRIARCLRRLAAALRASWRRWFA